MDWKWPLRPDHKIESQNGDSPLPWKERFCFPYSSLISNVQESGFDVLFVSEELSSWSQFPFAPSKDNGGVQWYKKVSAPNLGAECEAGPFCGLRFVPICTRYWWSIVVSPKSLGLQVHMHMVTSCAENRCDQEPSWLFIPAKLFSSPSAMFSFHTS